MADESHLNPDQFELLGQRGVRIGGRTFPSVSNDEVIPDKWHMAMVPMENGGLANVDYDATEGTPRFNVGAPRHQLGIKEGNPELDHLFTHHPRGSNLTSPEEVNSLLDEMSTKPLSQESVNKNRKWMQIVKSTQEDG